MKHGIKLSLLTAALLMAGCGDNSSSSTNEPQYESYIQEALSRDTTIKFALQGTNASVPLPSFALMNTSDGTLEIPTEGDDELTNPRASMGTMDGWSTTMPLLMDFEGAGLADGLVTSGIYLVELTDSMTGSPSVKSVLVQGTDFVAVADSASDRINIVLSKDLNPSSEYILAVTDEVTDVNGDPVGTSSSYAALKSKSKIYETGAVASAQQVTQGVETIFTMAGIADTTDIIYSTWFSTQSVGDTLYAVKGATATALNQDGGLASVWKDGANPNNVDLSTAYAMVFGTTQDFNTAIDNDADFDKYIDPDGTKKAGIKALYTGAGADVNVTHGQVALPYYLETDADWNSQPMESAMPSLALIKEALADDNEKAIIGAQLLAAGIDATKLATDVTEQLKLVGLTLTKSDGSVLDADRILTRYAPVPQVKSLQNAEFLLFTPNGGNPTNVVIYQHGITSAKENAYAFAFNLAQAGIAVIAIDLPLHGSRSLDDSRSANADVLAYLNLNNLAVARDNVRQSVLDVLGLRASLVTSLQAGLLVGSPLQSFNPMTGSEVKLLGHSLGGIVGTTAVAAGNKSLGSDAADMLYSFSGASIQNSGGQIANLLLGSSEFGPQIKHNLTSALSADYKSYADSSCSADKQKECYEQFESMATAETLATLAGGFSEFAYAAQTVLDTVDPYTNASNLLTSDKVNIPFYMTEVDQDDTVPNSVTNAPFAGTEPLAAKLGLATVNSSTALSDGAASFVQFNSTALHSTFVAPQQSDNSDLPNYAQMQTSNGEFLAAGTLVSAPSVATLK
ncbi:VolA/Pla-1 family phospholipase [Vibrio proteolyticus]